MAKRYGTPSNLVHTRATSSGIEVAAASGMHLLRGSAGEGREGVSSPEEADPNERPTIPAPPPLESDVRLVVSRVPCPAATVDIVTCDLRQDWRSESFDPTLMAKVIRIDRARRLRAGAPTQNESPPSTSTVRELK